MLSQCYVVCIKVGGGGANSAEPMLCSMYQSGRGGGASSAEPMLCSMYHSGRVGR